MNIKSFLSDALGFGLASFLTKGVALLVVPILTRSLNPSEYGVFELLVGLGGLFTVLVSMSLESYLARVWGDLDGQSAKSRVFTSLLLTVIFVGGMALLSVWLMSHSLAESLFDDAGYSRALFLMCFSAGFTAIIGLPLMALRMDRRIKAFVAVVSSQSMSYLFIIFWLLNANNISVSHVALATLASTGISLCVGVFLVKRYLTTTLSLTYLSPALRFGLPLLPAVGVTWVNSQVDKYALLYFYDTAVVGEFAVLTKVAAVVTMAVMVFRQAWLPYTYALARREDRGVRHFRQILMAYYWAGLIGCFIIVYFIDSIIGFLAPYEYSVAKDVIPVLLLAAIVYGSASIVNVGTMVSGRTEWNSYASLVGVTLNIALTAALVPVFGVAGAAWGTLVASFVFMLFLSWRSNKLLAIKFNHGQVLALSGGFLLCSFAVL